MTAWMCSVVSQIWHYRSIPNCPSGESTERIETMLNRLQDVFKSFQQHEVKKTLSTPSEPPDEKLIWKMYAYWNCLIRTKLRLELLLREKLDM